MWFLILLAGGLVFLATSKAFQKPSGVSPESLLAESISQGASCDIEDMRVFLELKVKRDSGQQLTPFENRLAAEIANRCFPKSALRFLL